MDNCIFCKIARKEIPADIVYEDDAAVAFLDIQPMAPGHTLVVPRAHAAGITDLPEELFRPLLAAVQKVSRRLMLVFSPDGLSYGVNQGRAAGQHVDHLHIHLVPRWHDDGGGSFQSIVHNPPKEDLKSLAEKIRNANIS